MVELLFVIKVSRITLCASGNHISFVPVMNITKRLCIICLDEWDLSPLRKGPFPTSFVPHEGHRMANHSYGGTLELSTLLYLDLSQMFWF